MPIPETFTQQEVDSAIGELKALLDDAEDWFSFDQLERELPRFAYLFRNDPVLIYLFKELPQSEIDKPDFCWDSPLDPKKRLSKQIAVLIAVGEGTLDLWTFSEFSFGKNDASDFWEKIYNPAIRDILRYVTLAQKDFAARKKISNSPQKQSANVQKNYALDLFISHSSKDKKLASVLIKFLCTALAIPHDRARCTSVDGYKLSGGAKTDSVLQKEIQGAKCFIGLITPDSLKSQFVLFELGARWGSDEHLVPILGGGIKASTLHPPLSNLNALNSASKSEMEQLVHELAKVLKKSVPLPTIYRSQISTLMKIKTKTQLDNGMKNDRRRQRVKGTGDNLIGIYSVND